MVFVFNVFISWDFLLNMVKISSLVLGCLCVSRCRRFLFWLLGKFRFIRKIFVFVYKVCVWVWVRLFE